MISIVFVLKTGGDFIRQDVVALKNGIMKNTTRNDLDFICLSDVNIDDVKTIKFKKRRLGWWNKLEIFRPDIYCTDRIFYFDLDTVIVGNIDSYFDIDDSFCGLSPWNQWCKSNSIMASGLMSWTNNERLERIFENDIDTSIYEKGDQEYITSMISKLGIKWAPLQERFNGIYSYKRECKNGLPDDAKIVCFHGKPRPRFANEGWVRKNYNG